MSEVIQRDHSSTGAPAQSAAAAAAAKAPAPAAADSSDIATTATTIDMLARLAAKDEARRAERAARQAAAAEGHDPKEDAERHLSDLARTVARHLAAVKAAAAAVEGNGSTPSASSDEAAAAAAAAAANAAAAEAARAALDAAARLEAATAAAAYYLPAYDLKQAAAALAELRAAAEAARTASAPRRKFAFSSRKPRAAAATAPVVADAGAGAPDRSCDEGKKATAATTDKQQQQCLKDGNNTSHHAAAAAATSFPHQLTPHEAALLARGAGAAGLTGVDIVRTADQLLNGEFFAADLTDCRLWLLGPLRALRLARLTRCTVVAGPVAGAAFVDGARDSALLLASHQVRLHSVTASDIYLRVRSRPVIEHCDGVRFAPLTDDDLAALGIAGLAAAAQLCGDGCGSGSGGSGGSAGAGAAAAVAANGGASAAVSSAASAAAAPDGDLWRCIDDFGWIKASASPHWAVLPEAERKPAPLPPPQPAAA